MSLQDKCSAILGKTYGEMNTPGLITATHEAPKFRFKLTNKPVSMENARYIAERQVGGAIIHWHGFGPERVATVYSRRFQD